MANAITAASRRWAVPALRRPSPATGVLLLLLLAAAAVLLYAGRHLTFFFDEWSWILGRRGGGLGTFLDPYNGHFSLFPSPSTSSCSPPSRWPHYTRLPVVGVAVHLLCCVLLYILVRRRVGPWLALVPTDAAAVHGDGLAGSPVAISDRILFLCRGRSRRAGTDRGRSFGYSRLTVLLVWSIVVVGRRDPVSSSPPPSRSWRDAIRGRACGRRRAGAVFVIWYLGWGSNRT